MEYPLVSCFYGRFSFHTTRAERIIYQTSFLVKLFSNQLMYSKVSRKSVPKPVTRPELMDYPNTFLTKTQKKSSDTYSNAMLRGYSKI